MRKKVVSVPKPFGPVRFFDNGGATIDRYTAVYLTSPLKDGSYESRGMSEYPFHPQGFGQMGTAVCGEHLGREITFQDLPEDCQKLVLQDLGCDPSLL